MELVDKHRECLKRISTPVISIGKRIPEFNRVRLWFDNNLTDHFIRFLQGNGNHKRRLSRQNIRSTAFNHFRNFRAILRLSFLIAGTNLLVSIIKHDVRIFRHYISQNKPFCFQKIHNFYQYSAFFSAYSCSSFSAKYPQYSLYYRVVVFRAPLQGLVLHCNGCCRLVSSSYRKTVPERLQPQPFTVLLIS